jgi:hypothetical protein
MTAAPPPSYESLRQAAKALGIDWSAVLTRARKIETLELKLALETESKDGGPVKEDKTQSKVEEMHAYWQKVTGLKWALSPKHRQTWRLMLEEMKDPARRKLAVDGLLLSPWHNGDNSERRKWHDPIYVRKWADKFADLASESHAIIPEEECKSLDAERFGYQQHFIDTLHAKPGGWKEGMDPQRYVVHPLWRVVTPFGLVPHLGIDVSAFDDHSLDHYAILHAAARYAHVKMVVAHPKESRSEACECAVTEAGIAVHETFNALVDAHRTCVNRRLSA